MSDAPPCPECGKPMLDDKDGMTGADYFCANGHPAICQYVEPDTQRDNSPAGAYEAAFKVWLDACGKYPPPKDSQLEQEGRDLTKKIVDAVLASTAPAAQRDELEGPAERVEELSYWLGYIRAAPEGAAWAVKDGDQTLHGEQEVENALVVARQALRDLFATTERRFGQLRARYDAISLKNKRLEQRIAELERERRGVKHE